MTLSLLLKASPATQIHFGFAVAALVLGAFQLARHKGTASHRAFGRVWVVLEHAVRSLPIGTAYAVWTGIGGVGVAVIGMAFLGDPITPVRVACLTLLVISLVGLKLSSGH